MLKPTGPSWQAAYRDRVQVVLRELTPADAVPLQEVLCDPEVMRYGFLRTPEDCVTFVDEARAMYAAYGLGPWAVCVDDDPALIGYCALRRGLDWQADDEIEIGYRLVSRMWGKGIATIAASHARDLAFDTFGAGRLLAAIDPNNAASIRVATRIGMRHDGEIMFPEYDYPDLRFTLSRAEWESRSTAAG